MIRWMAKVNDEAIKKDARHLPRFVFDIQLIIEML